MNRFFESRSSWSSQTVDESRRPPWTMLVPGLTASSEGFSQCTPYTIQINATDKANLQLVPGPVSNPWTFLAFCDNPYMVSTSPRNIVGVS